MTREADPAPRFVEVESILYGLAKLVSQTQEVIDRRNLDSARVFLESDIVGFSLGDRLMVHRSDTEREGGRTESNMLPLSSLVSFQGYRISELLVDFGVVPEPGSGAAGGQERFRVVPIDSPVEHMRLARFKVVGGEQIFGEFQIAGELKATVTLVRS